MIDPLEPPPQYAGYPDVTEHHHRNYDARHSTLPRHHRITQDHYPEQDNYANQLRRNAYNHQIGKLETLKKVKQIRLRKD